MSLYHKLNFRSADTGKRSIIALLFIGAVNLCFYWSPFVGFILMIAAVITYSLIRPTTTKKFFDLQRVLATSKIRSMANGLVELRGTVETLQPLKSPIDGVKCVAYRYTIHQISKDSEGKEIFSTIKDETVCPNFILKDDTGSVEIKTAGIILADLPLNMESREGNKSYLQYLLQPGDDVLLIGKASVENGKKVIEKDDTQDMLVLTPFSNVEMSNKHRPLVIRMWIYLSITAFLVALVLAAPLHIEHGRVFISFSLDMLFGKHLF
ncbi:hypothetical protein [Serratia microhaemolytica]|uniref:hypothetical protein n=1 Tax=Serratia microhaemolytica TaxID=2675110 RepID=UPI000FDEBBBB|nr:hypothetical protein [Serratia microhaemolytica]